MDRQNTLKQAKVWLSISWNTMLLAGHPDCVGIMSGSEIPSHKLRPGLKGDGRCGAQSPACSTRFSPTLPWLVVLVACIPHPEDWHLSPAAEGGDIGEAERCFESRVEERRTTCKCVAVVHAGSKNLQRRDSFLWKKEEQRLCLSCDCVADDGSERFQPRSSLCKGGGGGGGGL